jgi:Leucine-rich repeat (LRR) protein
MHSSVILNLLQLLLIPALFSFSEGQYTGDAFTSATRNVKQLSKSEDSSVNRQSGFDVLMRVNKCNTKFATLNCDSLELEDLPTAINFPEQIEFADFRNNKLSSLTSGAFYAGRKVKALYFANNGIYFIEASVFENLTSITHLDLSHNYLSTIPELAFSGLIQLNTIDLGYNKIKLLTKDVFLQPKGNFFLKELRLNHNEMKELDEDLFTHLFHMDALDLEDNVLETLPDYIFRFNSRLRDLKLSMNHFRTVPSNALRSAKVLEILDLSSNRFKEISYQDFAHLITLTRLRISRCLSLERIKEHAFQDVLNLRQLFIEYNRKLKEIHPKAFISNTTGDNLCELTEVSLKGNALSTLSQDSLPWKIINDLDFSDNPWRCDCHMKWIVNLTVNERTEENYICKQPYKHFNQRIKDMTSEDFSCSLLENDVFIVGGILLVILTATGLTSIGFLIAKLKIVPKIVSAFSPRKSDSTSNYVRVVPHSEEVVVEWDRTLKNPYVSQQSYTSGHSSQNTPDIRIEPPSILIHPNSHLDPAYYVPREQQQADPVPSYIPEYVEHPHPSVIRTNSIKTTMV